MDMSFAGHPGPKAMRLNISPATVNTVSKTTVENVSPNSPNGADSANHAGFGKGLASNASVSPRSSSRSSGLAPKVPPAKPKQFHLHPQQQPKQRSNSQKRSPPRASSGSGSTTTASTTAGSLQVPPRERVQNGRWSIAEHNAFIAGLAKHGRNWKAIARHVITRTTVQVRTHAQKYFLKCKKTGQAEITFSSPSRRGTAGSRNSRRRSGSGSGGNDVVEHEKAKSKEASPQTTTSQSPTKRRKRKSTTLTAVTDDPQSVEVAESQKTFESPTKLRAKEADRVSTPPALAHMAAMAATVQKDQRSRSSSESSTNSHTSAWSADDEDRARLYPVWQQNHFMRTWTNQFVPQTEDAQLQQRQQQLQFQQFHQQRFAMLQRQQHDEQLKLKYEYLRQQQARQHGAADETPAPRGHAAHSFGMLPISTPSDQLPPQTVLKPEPQATGSLHKPIIHTEPEGEFEQWTEQEHDTFVRGLALYGRNWSLISQTLKTRTTAQVRAHAQRVFLKQERSGNRQDMTNVTSEDEQAVDKLAPTQAVATPGFKASSPTIRVAASNLLNLFDLSKNAPGLCPVS